jgi:hypothetical protein
VSEEPRPVRFSCATNPFRHLVAEVRKLFSLGPGVRLYHFESPEDIVFKEGRSRIADDAALEAYLHKEAPSAVFVFPEDKSPNVSPVRDRPEHDAASGSVKTRSSQAQEIFRDAVVWRDGPQCVCCGLGAAQGIGVEAAHLIAWGAVDIAHSLGLASPFEARNGITLCHGCHQGVPTGFDHRWWCMRPDGVICVSADVLANPTRCGAHAVKLAERHGQRLRRPEGAARASNWPPEALFSLRWNEFLHAEEVRKVAAPFKCDKCLMRCKSKAGLTKHKCRALVAQQ